MSFNRQQWMRDYMRDTWYPKNKLRHKLTNYASRRKRIEKINAYKLEKGCADCGYKKYACALDFDHLGNKKFGINDKGFDLKWERVLKEIKKCEVVCANCHRIRTWKRMLKNKRLP